MNLIKAKVLGSRRIDYTNKAGNVIQGFEYHFTYQDDNVSGSAAGSAFISDRDCGSAVFKVGDIVTFAHDPYGKRKFNYLPL